MCWVNLGKQLIVHPAAICSPTSSWECGRKIGRTRVKKVMSQDQDKQIALLLWAKEA